MHLTPKVFFIIAGLPRSGTAWLATALNLHPDICAFHEGFVTDGSYLKRMQRALDTYKVVVDCTTNLDPAFDSAPATRIFLERDFHDCVTSVRGIFEGWTGKMRAAGMLADKWRDKHAPMSISFDDITGPARGKVFNLLCAAMNLPNKISSLKLEQLGSMNVQLHNLSGTYYDDKTLQTHP